MRTSLKPLSLVLLLMMVGCGSTYEALPTQPGIALERYAGTWYEQARLPNRFQKDCSRDVRADYVLQADGNLQVTNQCRTRRGEIDIAHGEGRLARLAPPDPAKLEVR